MRTERRIMVAVGAIVFGWIFGQRANAYSIDGGTSISCFSQRTVLFINFDGAPLVSARDDSSRNYAALVDPVLSPADFPSANLEESEKAEVLRMVAQSYQPFHVVVVGRRPLDNNYTMVMVGGREAAVHKSGADGYGSSLFDFRNQLQNDVAAVFSEKILADSSSRADFLRSLATAILHESGHTFGLQHVKDPTSVMNPIPSADRLPLFQDRTHVFNSYPMPSLCGLTSYEVLQNEHQLLLELLGAGACFEPPHVNPWEKPREVRFAQDECYTVDGGAPYYSPNLPTAECYADGGADLDHRCYSFDGGPHDEQDIDHDSVSSVGAGRSVPTGGCSVGPNPGRVSSATLRLCLFALLGLGASYRRLRRSPARSRQGWIARP